MDAYLGRGRYERGEGFRGYRNGSSLRRLTLGSGTIALETPRVRDVPPRQEPFASVRLRTNAAKRFKKTKSGVYLVHEVMKRLQQRWRRLKSAHLCATVPLREKRETKVA